MKQLSGKDLMRLLKKQGWHLVRIHGSHHVFMKEGNPARISVPVHAHRPLKIGLLKHLLTLAEIDENKI